MLPRFLFSFRISLVLLVVRFPIYARLMLRIGKNATIVYISMLKAGRSLRSTRRGVSTTKQTSLLSRVLSKSCDATESLRNFEIWKRKCVEYYLYCATYWKPMSRSFGFLNQCLESVQTIDFNTTKQSFMLLTSYSAMSSVLN